MATCEPRNGTWVEIPVSGWNLVLSVTELVGLFTAGELIDALGRDPDLWRRAVERGKHLEEFRRSRAPRGSG